VIRAEAAPTGAASAGSRFSVRILEKARAIVRRTRYWFNWVAGLALVGLMLLTCADVIGRALNMPVPGTYEIVGFLGTTITAFALAYTYVQGGHTAIEYLVDRLPERAHNWVRAVNAFVGAALFTMLAWRSFVYGTLLLQSGSVSLTEKIPFYPFVYGLGVACVPLVLLLLLDMVKALTQAVKR
jgi:TRAP-type C4-dicarboxylate transport system permease small subunit